LHYLTFKYSRFSYCNTSTLLSFYIEERPIFDAGADGVAGAVFRDTQPLRQLRKQTSVPHCVIGGCNRSSQIRVFLEAVFNMLSVLWPGRLYICYAWNVLGLSTLRRLSTAGLILCRIICSSSL